MSKKRKNKKKYTDFEEYDDDDVYKSYDKYILQSYDKSLTLDDPSDITNRKPSYIGPLNKAKDDMFANMIFNSSLNHDRYSIHGFDYNDAMYKTSFEVNQITDSINANKLKRGD